jgi:hypothetical protein
MRTKTWQRNTSGLVAHAHRRAEISRARVQTAIEALLRTGRPITFQAVAAAAQVSKAYLYQQPALRKRIEHLRTQTVAPQQSTQSARSDKSAGVLLAAKERRIKQLEAENRQLRAELQGALAQLYERL